jgi:hypothetical protein
MVGRMLLLPPGLELLEGQRRLLPPAEELSRFMKIVARLRWKLPFLAEGYRLAMVGRMLLLPPGLELLEGQRGAF